MDTYSVRVTAPGGKQGAGSRGDQGGEEEQRQPGLQQGRRQPLMSPLPYPAPPLQASAPGSAVDYPLQGLELHTNYTATVHGLRGPNLTSAASITFTTGASCEGWGGEGKCKEGPPPSSLLHSPARFGGPPGLGGQRSDPPHSSAYLD